MGDFRAAHTRTALIWEYPLPPSPTHTPGRPKRGKKSLINDFCLTDRQTNRKERKTKENSLINDLCLTDRHSVKQRSFNDTGKKEKRRKTH